MSSQESFYEFGPFRLDARKRRLLREGEPISLAPKAFDTLLVLVEHTGRTIEKDDLMEAVWPGVVVEENNLNQSITALRKSLGDSRHESQYIATIPGIGYRFVATVTKVVDNKTTNAPLEVEESTFAKAPPRPDSTNRNRTRKWVSFSIVVATLVVLGYFVWNRQKTSGPAYRLTSIAVLPLENLSGDPAQEYFADGMTDALIGDLAKISELRVISRTSSMQYKGSKKSLPEIANELKVDAIVEGTVQRIGERVQVRAQLIHAPTDQHLWVETYQRDVQNILDLQSEIARAIAREVQIKISPEEQARLTSRRSVNPKSFDDYLQGRYLFWNKRTEENLLKAIAYFESAIKADPSYALAYVALADCYNALGTVQMGALPPREARSRAEASARKALELDSSVSEAHSALGYVNHFNWNWSVAEQEFKRAIELNPSSATAYNSYAGFLMSRGQVDASIAASNRARELDPLSLAIGAQRGFLLENARRYDEAIEQLERVISLDPNHYQAYWMLGHTYAVSGKLEKAIEAAEKAVALSERAPGALGILGMIYGLAGRKVEATKILSELMGLTDRRYVTPAAVAWVYVGLGDKDQAFAWLEKAYEERSGFMAYFKVVPIVDPIRSDPRYSEMVRRVGLPE